MKIRVLPICASYSGLSGFRSFGSVADDDGYVEGSLFYAMRIERTGEPKC